MTKAKTFADEAKTIMNRYKLRLGEKFDKGDNMSLEAMNQELSALRDKQEESRNKLKIGNEYCRGGKLRKKQLGGELLDEPEIGLENWMTDPSAFNAPSGSTSSPTSFKSRVPWAGAASSVLGNLLMNKEIDLPEYEYEEYKPTKATAHLVDYSRGREQTLRERDQANALIRQSAKGFGSQSALMENILTGVTGTQRATGEAFGKSFESQENINAQIQNQLSQFNVAQEAQAARVNLQNKMFGFQAERQGEMFGAQRKDARTKGIFDAVSGYTKDRMAADQYDQMLAMMAPDNYMFGMEDDSTLRKILQVSPKMKRMFLNTGDKATG